MIPKKLTLTNFLSYHHTTEVDFSTIHLACISGNNGAGKSTLLDAMTWALFGKARRSDDAIIHGNEDECRVILEFLYEDETYQIHREKKRGKTGSLDLFVFDPINSKWVSNSEKSIRETEAKIEQILRMDYETFINASFFLQGKADQFTQQKPSDRKRILSNILGLDIWETYKEKAAEKRKSVESQITLIESRMEDIRKELAEENQRKQKLAELEEKQKQTSRMRKQQETLLGNLRQLEGTFKEQKKLLDSLKNDNSTALTAHKNLETRLQMLHNEMDGYQEIINHKEEITAQYQQLQEVSRDLKRWEQLQLKKLELEKKLAEPTLTIEKTRAKYLQEKQQLESGHQQVVLIKEQMNLKKAELAPLAEKTQKVKDFVSQREKVEADISDFNQKIAEMTAENSRLDTEMKEMATRRDQLQQMHATNCPLCGQNLSEAHRSQVLDDILKQGKEKGDAFRSNRQLLEEAQKYRSELDLRLREINKKENELRGLDRQADQLKMWIDQNQKTLDEWEQTGSGQLASVSAQLQADDFCPMERKSMVVIEQEIAGLGYNPAAHEQAKQDELRLHPYEEKSHQLDKANAALVHLRRETEDLEKQKTDAKLSLEKLEARIIEINDTCQNLNEKLAPLPDIERELNELIGEDNNVQMEMGAARQNVAVLDTLRERMLELERERENQAIQVGRYKTLERAFSKDGVPALLIEQALPEIEMEANDILEKLSGGVMRINFLTQRDFKDRNREDKKETLDIQISDINGTRDYEMYSGGEAFRVNFAIRLAMSRELAKRAGARLQTLVIDEGFGSQDAAGRQRLIEAIHMVQDDFAKVFVITHLEELKDAFPHRIEVEKTSTGSSIKVIS